MPPELSDGFTLWFTGLSGSGKTTLSRLLEQRFLSCGARVELLDGDVVRKHLSKDLGYSREDRDENVRRIGFVSRLLNRNGVITIVAAISPYRSARDEMRATIPNFIEAYTECPLDILIARDVKGLYKKALAGEIAAFSGISDPYQVPLNAEIVIDTSSDTPERSADLIWQRLNALDLVAFGPQSNAD